MADLTQQNIDNYRKLIATFLNRNLTQEGGKNPFYESKDNTISELSKTIFLPDQEGQLKNSENQKSLTIPSDTNELSQKIDALDLYLKILNFRKIQLFKTTNDEEQAKFEEEFFNSLDELKSSLKVVEDEAFDLTKEIKKRCLDSVILDFLKDEAVKEQTEALLEDRDPNLKNVDEIKKLTNAWTTAVNAFVKDAQSGKDNGAVDPVVIAKPDTQKTLANFFCFHENLETLYTKLAKNKIVQKNS